MEHILAYTEAVCSNVADLESENVGTDYLTSVWVDRNGKILLKLSFSNFSARRYLHLSFSGIGLAALAHSTMTVRRLCWKARW
jgi:hypothetical protein